MPRLISHQITVIVSCIISEIRRVTDRKTWFLSTHLNSPQIWQSYHQIFKWCEDPQLGEWVLY